MLLFVCLTHPTISAQQNRSIDQLLSEAGELYNKKDFEQSLERYSKALELGSTDATVAYNAACCAALCGNQSVAYQFLDRAIARGWIDVEHLKRDSDLRSLHKDPRWTKTVALVESLVEQERNRWSDKAFQSRFVENISDAEKAAGLSKLWAEVKFNFVNFHLVPDLDWNEQYVEYMPKVLASKSTLEYYRLLEELVAKLKDGHTNVYLPSKLDTRFNARPQLRSRLIEDRVIIIKVLNSKLASAGIEVGQEVIKIDGVPVKNYAKRNIAPFMAASTQQDLATKTFESQLFRGPLDQEIELELLSPAGKKLTAKIERSPTNRLVRFLKRPAPLSFKMIDGQFAHIRLTSFATTTALKDFKAAFEKIEKADGLILDLRENSGGNSGVGWEILGYLTDKPFLMTQWHTNQYIPTYRAWNRKSISQFRSGAKMFQRIAAQHYQKPVVMLVSPRTFSAAEDMAAAFDMIDRGKIIGQPTGGSTGQPLSFALPGGGRARVCTKHDSYGDGTEFVGKGIQPDILVETKVQDVIDGFDRAVDVAKRELQK